MDRLIFTSLASINERRLLREQLNNELANISTVGFKRSFDSAMTAVKAEGDGFDSRIQPFIQQKDAVSMAPGTLMATGRSTDIAINEKGVLGALAGTFTGLIHTKLGIDALLSGILVMTAMYSVNLMILGRSNIPLIDIDSIFNKLPFSPVEQYNELLVS